ncbi:carbohydrate kinase family protein [Alteromonas sp. H39]|uniref:carbohydrate kinase family protein n=1 Tax=Alteromonas sp. H39 TaxID=3389876 RepID=UPI0039E133D3
MMSKKVICIGEALIDFVCTDVGENNTDREVYLRKPGGAPANVSACIGRLGGHAEFIGAVGDDAFGDYLIETLKKYHVGVSGTQKVSVPTTLAFVTLQDNGEREFIFHRGADAEFVFSEEDDGGQYSNDIFHFGSATAFLDGSLQDAYFAMAERCRENNSLVCFDPNYRVDLWKSRLEIFKAKCNAFFKLADVVKVSEEELQLLTGESDLQVGCSVIHKLGVGIIFVTMGSKGCHLSTNQEAHTIPAFKINAIDTTGAGDAFIGAMLFKLASFDSVDCMTVKELRDAVMFAQKVSATVCEKMGAMTALPTESEVQSREFEVIG